MRTARCPITAMALVVLYEPEGSGNLEGTRSVADQAA
jgi:hypothetical protein